MIISKHHRNAAQLLLAAPEGVSAPELAPAAAGWTQDDDSRRRFDFGTKAETLMDLQRVLQTAEIPDLLYFSVAEWRVDEAAVLLEIGRRFDGSPIVLRSSAQSEDGEAHSQAGAFASCLDIDSGDPRAVREAIQTVVESFAGDPEDQVLVMPMHHKVTLSGVLMTHALDTGAP